MFWYGFAMFHKCSPSSGTTVRHHRNSHLKIVLRRLSHIKVVKSRTCRTDCYKESMHYNYFFNVRGNYEGICEGFVCVVSPRVLFQRQFLILKQMASMLAKFRQKRRDLQFTCGSLLLKSVALNRYFRSGASGRVVPCVPCDPDAPNVIVFAALTLPLASTT